MSLEVEVALVFFGTSSERPEFNNHNQRHCTGRAPFIVSHVLT